MTWRYVMEWMFTILLGMCAMLAYRQRKMEGKHDKFYDELRQRRIDKELNEFEESIQAKDIETKVEEPVKK